MTSVYNVIVRNEEESQNKADFTYCMNETKNKNNNKQQINKKVKQILSLYSYKFVLCQKESYL